MSAAQTTPELVADARATLGEGPAWDGGRGVLWWVDIVGQRVHRFDPATGEDRAVDVGSAVGAIALRRDGSLLLALAAGLATLDADAAFPAADGPAAFAARGPRSAAGRQAPGVRAPASGLRAPAPPVVAPTTLLPLGSAADGLRCNDAKCDPAGRLWVGRLAFDLAPGAGSLLRVDPDLRVSTALTGLAIPNGLGWSPDGRTMYFVDSAWGEVRRFPYDPATGAIGDGEPLVRFDPAAGVPDGLTIDAAGHLWVALWGGGAVVRVAPDGGIVDRVELPVSRVSSCTFGGADLGDLFITTARAGATPAELAREPHAGGLFRCRPGVGGPTPVPFDA